jgi:dihydrofolate reductase
MSLDGYIAGVNDSIDRPIGDNGELLHRWVYELKSWRKAHGLEGGASGPSSDVIAESMDDVGAVVLGRRMFDFGETYWGDEPPFHAPVFVVTNRPRASETKQGGTSYTFVTDGLEAALDAAAETAGEQRLHVAGGADIIRQCIASDRLDELQIHLVPVLLGGGKRLFETSHPPRHLKVDRLIETPDVTHIRYDLRSNDK